MTKDRRYGGRTDLLITTFRVWVLEYGSLLSAVQCRTTYSYCTVQYCTVLSKGESLNAKLSSSSRETAATDNSLPLTTTTTTTWHAQSFNSSSVKQRRKATFIILMLNLVNVPCLEVSFCWIGKKCQERLAKTTIPSHRYCFQP